MLQDCTVRIEAWKVSKGKHVSDLSMVHAEKRRRSRIHTIKDMQTCNTAFNHPDCCVEKNRRLYYFPRSGRVVCSQPSVCIKHYKHLPQRCRRKHDPRNSNVPAATKLFQSGPSPTSLSPQAANTKPTSASNAFKSESPSLLTANTNHVSSVHMLAVMRSSRGNKT